FVMTDWGACAGAFGTAGNPIPDCSTAGAAASGLDQEQPAPSFYSAGALGQALAAGQLRAGRLDDMVRRILGGVFAGGLFDDPVTRHPIDVAAGAVVAGRIEQQAAVLLRNSHGALPLDATKVGSLAVIGATAAGPPPLAGFLSSADVVPILPDNALAAI